MGRLGLLEDPQERYDVTAFYLRDGRCFATKERLLLGLRRAAEAFEKLDTPRFGCMFANTVLFDLFRAFYKDRLVPYVTTQWNGNRSCL